METMKRIVAVALLFGITASLWAGDVNWKNTSGDRLWRNAANWQDKDTLVARVPSSSDKAAIRQAGDGPIIDSSTVAVANTVVLGDHSSPADELDITGGSLTTNSWFILGYGSSNDGTFNVSGGVTNCNQNLKVGNKGAGQINMTSGSITVSGELGVSVDADGLGTSSGHIQLDGGTISCGSINIQDRGSIDITRGTLIIDGDATGVISVYDDDGQITAFDGAGWVISDYNTTTTGKTTVVASDTPPPGPAAPAFPPGDFDDDYDVDIDDVFLLASHWLSSDFPVDFDINDDGSVNGIEFSHLAEYWRHKSKNVVFITIDDLNLTVESYGHTVAQTPQMDFLADRGMRFENALCNYPVCNASRASFLSGLRPDTTGITSNTSPYMDFIPDRISLPRLFRNNGYHTKRLGKIFHRDGEYQDAQAWDEEGDPATTAIGNTGTGRNMTEGPYELSWCRWLAANGDDEDQSDGLIAKEAVEFLQQDHDKPFFLALGFHKPHDPFIAPAAYFDMYPLTTCDPPVVPASWSPLGCSNIPCASMDAFGQFVDQDRREFLRAYYACTTFVDAQIGKVIQALDDNEMTDDTIIILFGDHGYHLGEHRHWNKVTVFEKCHRAPFIVLAPDSLAPAGSVTEQIIEYVDIYPTLAEMCRLKEIPSDLEGVSFQPLLDDPDQPWKEAGFIQVERDGMGRAVQTDRWRYVEWQNSGNRELYDSVSDPTEYNNLIDDPQYADVILYLQQLLQNGQNRFLPTAVDLIDGTFLHWKLDESAGLVALDESANNLDGTLVNMDDSDWVAGMNGNALDFDGVDDYVEVIGYRGVTGAASRTCMAWLKTSTVEGSIMTWGNSSINGWGWDFRLQDFGGYPGRLTVAVKGGYKASRQNLADGNWHHVAAVLVEDGSPSTADIKLYIDGVEDTTIDIVDHTINTASVQNVTIGASDWYFDGLIDDVRIYDRALSPSEIAQIAQ